jgi:hypothetical protein
MTPKDGEKRAPAETKPRIRTDGTTRNIRVMCGRTRF